VTDEWVLSRTGWSRSASMRPGRSISWSLSAHGLRNEFYLISYVAFRPTDVRKENRASSHSEELLLNKTLSDLIQFRPRWGCAIIFPHAPTLLRVRE
jgi:hypothetical protein